MCATVSSTLPWISIARPDIIQDAVLSPDFMQSTTNDLPKHCSCQAPAGAAEASTGFDPGELDVQVKGRW
jgi:hypothetical protein